MNKLFLILLLIPVSLFAATTRIPNANTFNEARAECIEVCEGYQGYDCTNIEICENGGNLPITCTLNDRRVPARGERLIDQHCTTYYRAWRLFP